MVSSYEVGQSVRVRWQGSQWVPAVVQRIYTGGLDATVGVSGVNYFSFADVKSA
jgi:hypothetical protein